MGDYTEMDEQSLREQLSEAPDWKARQTIRRALSHVIHIQRHKPQPEDDVTGAPGAGGRRRSSVVAPPSATGRRKSSVTAPEAMLSSREGRRRSSVVAPSSAPAGGREGRRRSSVTAPSTGRRKSSVTGPNVQSGIDVSMGAPNHVEERLARRRSSVATPDLAGFRQNATQASSSPRKNSVVNTTGRRSSLVNKDVSDNDKTSRRDSVTGNNRRGSFQNAGRQVGTPRPASGGNTRRSSIVKETQSSINRRTANPPPAVRRAWDPPPATRRNSLLALTQRRLVSGGPKTDFAKTGVIQAPTNLRKTIKEIKKEQQIEADEAPEVPESSPPECATVPAITVSECENITEINKAVTGTEEDIITTSLVSEPEATERRLSPVTLEETPSTIAQPRLRGFRPMPSSRRRSSNLTDIRESPHEISRLQEIAERRPAPHSMRNAPTSAIQRNNTAPPGVVLGRDGGDGSGVDYSAVQDERQLENMLNQASDYWERKKIRNALSDLRRRRHASPEESDARHVQTVQITLQTSDDKKLSSPPPQPTSSSSNGHVKDTTSIRTDLRSSLKEVAQPAAAAAATVTSSSSSSSHLQRAPPPVATGVGTKPKKISLIRQNSLGDVLNSLIASSKMEGSDSQTDRPKPRIISLGRSQSMKSGPDHFRRPLFRDMVSDKPADKSTNNLGQRARSRLANLSPEEPRKERKMQSTGSSLSPIGTDEEDNAVLDPQANTTSRERRSGLVTLGKTTTDASSRPNSLHSFPSLPANTLTTPEGGEASVTTEQEIPLANGGATRMRTIFSKSRSGSQSEYTIQDTTMETKTVSPSGGEVVERNQITTRKRLTRQGSEYVQTDRVRSQLCQGETGEYVASNTDINVERDSMSVTSGQCSSERVQMKVMGQPEMVTVGEVGGSSDEEEESDTDDRNLTKVQEEEYPEIATPLEDQTVMDGEGITFTCSISGASGGDAKVSWHRGESQLNQADGFLMSYRDGEARLDIKEVFPDDEGQYRCLVHTENGFAETCAHLTVITQPADGQSLVTPSFTKTLTNVTAEVTAEAVFECHITGLPHPSITWYRGSLEVSLVEGVYEASFEGEVARLIIRGVITADKGMYTCCAKNSVGEARCQAQLTVATAITKKAPCFTKPLKDHSVQEGQAVCLKCHIAAHPPPVVSWYMGDQLAPPGDDFKQTFDGRVATLSMDEVFEDDEGEFTCVAENAAGKACSSGFLIIQAPASAPVFTSPLKPVAVKVGQSVTLTCEVEGHPSPSITWYLDEHLLPHGEEFKQRFNGTHASLTLGEVYEDDEGEFMCVVENDGGSARCKALLTVDDGPADAPPDITTPLTDAEGEEGRAVTLSCHIMGHPAPMVLWYCDHKLLRAGTEYRQKYEGDQATLRIRELTVEDCGKYECIARNNLGKASTSCSVKLKGQEMNIIHIEEDKSDEESSTMSAVNIDEIDDEDVLHKLMNQTENFDERKRIRMRMRLIRENRAVEFEKAKAARESNREDAVALRQRQATEAKAKKMAEYDETAKKGKQDTGIAEANLRERQARAEAEKQEKLDKYKEMAKTQSSSYHAIGDSIRKAEQSASDQFKEKRLQGFDDATKSPGGQVLPAKKPEDGKTTRNQQSRQVTQVGGFGGTSYAVKKDSAEDVAKKYADKFSNKASSTTSGVINVKTESWNSKDGVTKRTEKSQAWGGPRGAANMFKKMDASTAPPGGAQKPNYLAAPAGGQARAGVGVQRSPSAIKQMLLDWCKAQVAGYENVNVTNFSSSWNDGMAFCALIHHFFPDAFDFSRLNPKNRRGNFALAFDTAEKKADISPLLEVEDMVRFKNPDWKCVFCYVQSLYRGLRNLEQANNPPAPAQ